MANHNDLGKEGEDLAAAYYQKNGYRIRTRNWRFGRAEIDLICTKNDQVVIVEVKTRTSADFESPAELVNKRKQNALIKAAHAYIIENQIDLNCRFDILLVKMEGKNSKIEQIADAFYPLVK